MGLQAKKWLAKGTLLATVAIWSAVFTLPDSKLHVIFCDVGQGDGIVLIQGTYQVVVDGGPDNKILTCLARYTPFYDRKIEMVILTHPQADHMNGLLGILEHYQVEKFIMGPETNNTLGYQKLVDLVKTVSVSNVYTGDELRLGKLSFKIIWPAKDFVFKHLDDNTDLNSFAIVSKVSYGDLDILLTADADNQVWPKMSAPPQVEVLKVPHHGSKTGMTGEWLDQVKPQLAVISVGAKNRYGHPRQEILDLLANRNIKTLRTDQEGDVEVISDGKSWWVKSSNK